MIYLLNIGNTHTEIAAFDCGKIKLLGQTATSGINESILPPGKILAASVVPDATAKFTRKDIEFISAGNCRANIHFPPETAATIGADRVANCAALTHFCQLPALVVDCGTAITVEIVDANGRFAGGAIIPGRKLMRQALSQGTAQLPDIPLAEKVPQTPGVNTVSAMTYGIDGGLIHLLRGMLENIRQDIPVKDMLVTGGDAAFFAANIPELQMAPENFSFYGILMAGGVI